MILPEHGANPGRLAEQLGATPGQKLMDFSTNTSVMKHPLLTETFACSQLENYPDPRQERMRTVLGELYNMEEEQFLLTNGANEAIYLIASYCAHKKVGIVVPTYPEYEKALEAYGAQVVSISAGDFEDALSEEGHLLWSQMHELEVLFLCNPNNPTGRYYDEKLLEPLRNYMKENTLTLIIDESYIDFVLTKSIQAYGEPIWDLNQTIILRSLTKNYQLAGIRIAYLISSPYWVRKLAIRQPTWSVNSVALCLGEQLVTDQTFLDTMQSYYKEETPRFCRELRALGLLVMPSDVHFFLIETETDMSLIKWLLERGIAVRHTRNHRGLDGKYIRVATKTKGENNYFIQIMRERCRDI